MAALLPDRPNPQSTLNHVLITAAIVSLVALVAGVAGHQLPWHGPVVAPQTKLIVAEKAFQAGDDRTAAALFRNIAKNGNSTAQYWLAHMMELGLGTPRDPAKAIDLYEKAAQQKFVPAEIRLGEVYLYGKLVPPDAAKAKIYLENAADSGNARAAMLLGQIYRIGIGVPADPTKAYAWLEVATLEGNAFAERERNASFRTLALADKKSAVDQARTILQTIRNEAGAQKSGGTKQHEAGPASARESSKHAS